MLSKRSGPMGISMTYPFGRFGSYPIYHLQEHFNLRRGFQGPIRGAESIEVYIGLPSIYQRFCTLYRSSFPIAQGIGGTKRESRMVCRCGGVRASADKRRWLSWASVCVFTSFTKTATTVLPEVTTDTVGCVACVPVRRVACLSGRGHGTRQERRWGT